MKYISLGEWFDNDTEAKLIDDYRPDGIASGFFEGIRNGKLDEEICTFDEFRVESDNEQTDPQPTYTK